MTLEYAKSLWGDRADPEWLHDLAILGLMCERPYRNIRLDVRAFGVQFPNPLGLAAGFDKYGAHAPTYLDWGFGHVEVGTVTLRPQSGNDGPRLLLLEEQEALVNNYGFNNDGIDACLKKVARADGIIGVSIGINRDSTDPVSDYAAMIDRAQCDYITLNLSSPNTPGLIAGATPDHIQRILERAKTRTPILIKLSPDINPAQMKDIIEASAKAAGLVMSNTTVDHNADFSGGLSGAPLFERSTRALAQMYLAAENRFPIIGVGGVDSADKAYAKIRAGASLIQIYTGLMYKGRTLINDILDGLAFRLRGDGFARISEAVGIDADKWA